MSKSKGLSIGQFSQSSRLSVKALRHYDRLGLLKPAVVDAETSYRYYDRSQVPRAVAIAVLRSLDLPLSLIGSLVDAHGSNELTNNLNEARLHIKNELIRKQNALSSIERIIQAGQLIPYEPQLRIEPQHFVLYKEASVTPETLGSTTEDLVRALQVCGFQQGIQDPDPIFCIFNSHPKEDMLIQVCAAGFDYHRFKDKKLDIDISSMILPETSVVFVEHVGSYEELGLAHHALYGWIEENSYNVTGGLREIYINDPAFVHPEELRTLVLIPVQAK